MKMWIDAMLHNDIPNGLNILINCLFKTYTTDFIYFHIHRYNQYCFSIDTTLILCKWTYSNRCVYIFR